MASSGCERVAADVWRVALVNLVVGRRRRLSCSFWVSYVHVRDVLTSYVRVGELSSGRLQTVERGEEESDRRERCFVLRQSHLPSSYHSISKQRGNDDRNYK